VINLKGSVDVMVSPLMLEALQRFVFKNRNAKRSDIELLCHIIVNCCLLFVCLFVWKFRLWWYSIVILLRC